MHVHAALGQTAEGRRRRRAQTSSKTCAILSDRLRPAASGVGRGPRPNSSPSSPTCGAPFTRLCQAANIGPMLQAATVAIEEARLIVDTAAERGVAPATLLAHAGFGPATLEDSGARVSRAAFDRLLAEAVRLSGDRDFGLHAAERGDGVRRLPDALHYALTSGPTVGALFGTVSRYARLVHTDVEVTFVPDGGVVHVELDIPGSGAVARRHLAERWLGALVLLVRRHADAGFAPREVWFARPAMADTSAHERLFRAPLRFERTVDALVLGGDTLDVPVRGGDAGLQRVLEAYLATILPAVEPADLSQLVRRRLRAAAPGRLPTLESVARALAMSPRTLQRRLTGDGTTYQALVHEVREDLARGYLAESRLSISEIAFVLGFSDVSTFHRAFRRWTRQTPRAYRRHAATARASGRSGGGGADGKDSGAFGQDHAVDGP
jgi:AraC-like DNA-binding protein